MAERERERVGDRVEAALERSASAAIDEPPTAEPVTEAQRPSLRRTAIWLAITGVSLYLVFPSLVDVLGSAKNITRLDPAWLPVMLILQTASFVCLWELQRIALHCTPWKPVVLSQLAGNALGKVAPGGGAVGATLQYRMLVESGIQRAEAATGVTATNIIVLGVVLALPVLGLPAIVAGSVDRGLMETAVVGLVVFAGLAAAATVAMVSDRPLVWVGTQAQTLRNRLRRNRPPVTDLPQRLLAQRNKVLAAFGPQWRRALLAAVGRWAFDYATLLAALAAVGSRPRPILVLLAFCAAQVLAQIPVTPGGLGFVEAGLTALLALAGVPAGNAVLATFSYRLFNYWLPLPAGLAAWLIHRRDHAASDP